MRKFLFFFNSNKPTDQAYVQQIFITQAKKNESGSLCETGHFIGRFVSAGMFLCCTGVYVICAN